MKKFVAIILPALILSTAPFAQDLPKPSLKSIATSEEAPAAEPESAAAEESKSYRVSVNFEQNSLELAPLSAVALDSMSAVFARNKRHRYEVRGYSCPAEAEGKAIRLSTQRVERVVNRLLSLGIPGENIVAVYMAGEEPQAAKGVHNIMGGELARVMSEAGELNGQKFPTTYTIYLQSAANAAVPTSISTMTANVAANGYSETNPRSSAMAFQSNFATLLEYMMNEILTPMLSKTRR